MYVLYQSDDDYAPILGISMTSLLENNQDIESLKIFVAAHKIGEANKNSILGLANRYGREIEFIDMESVDDYLKNTYIPKWRGKYSPYYKLFLSQYLPDYVDRILYLDCDTVVMPRLLEANKVDLSDHVVAMVRVLAHKDYLSRLGAIKDYYYNAGAILFNMKNWKQFECEKILLEKIKLPLPLLYPEQDLMVLLFPDLIQKLPLRFNVDTWLPFCGANTFWRFYAIAEENFYTLEEISEAINHPVVAHCMDEIYDRPWEKGNFSPFKDVWDHYRTVSPWPEYELSRRRTVKRKVLKALCNIFPRPVYLRIYNVVIARNRMRQIKAFERQGLFENLQK